MILGHGDDGYLFNGKIKVNFSSNVFYDGPPKGLQEHLMLQWDNIARYPEANAESLQNELAKWHRLEPQQIIVTNGATEAFYLLAHFLQKKSATIIIPSFAEYNDACQIHNLSLNFVNWSEITETSRFATDALFLGNPNNPTGLLLSKNVLSSLLQNNPETLFVIDEAYVDFTTHPISMIDEITNFSNLVIVKSLTKTYAIPGLRLGYIISQSQNIQAIEKNKMPWSVNTFAIEAGKYIVKNASKLLLPIEKLMTDTAHFYNALQQIEHIEVYPTNTNFFLCKTQLKTASNLKEYLLHNHQLLIRDASNFRGLSAHYFRVATQKPLENQLLIDTICQWTML
ncbi:aminotransferase class I/II-fold pyridoxal phosphate-dependent enzyme [Flavobacterium oreochromis]|uniref:pyridoxal phosphate-dependent aminotransferase n=1 Tax=Flavobacterium oreochromis TaxID=2906078 RepID=UPI001CE58521|nr:aminotransferase class I/II-fold pyridoxal phosphate-dependent enzyme [Flavobacterium oreochromis]QYS86405.1 aminotransferase class I/II-fold pyridoxal phosphate-dependent enzyme [Flavobacterium oreochromis]